MSSKSERRAAREAVGVYHDQQLRELVHHVEAAVARFRTGEIDAYDVDEVIFHYSRAAKELWKFCNLGHVEIAAHIIRDEPPVDWWERGARRRR